MTLKGEIENDVQILTENTSDSEDWNVWMAIRIVWTTGIEIDSYDKNVAKILKAVRIAEIDVLGIADKESGTFWISSNIGRKAVFNIVGI